MHPYCYICGTRDAPLTDDHIPPESFFLKGDRRNLFKAPLCEPCHRPLSPDDEVMRFFFSIVDGVSESGRRIFVEKAHPKMRAKPKLWAQVQEYLKPMIVETPAGLEERLVAGLMQSRVIPFIRRITKGLLYLFNPHYDYSKDNFAVSCCQFTEVTDIIPHLKHASRGTEVFDVWYGFATDVESGGIWIYRFYNATCFVCMHGDRPEWQQQFPAGYKEWPKLPKHL